MKARTATAMNGSASARVADEKKYRRFLRYTVIATMFGGYADQYNVGVLSASSLFLIPYFHMSLSHYGFLTTVTSIGGAVGAILCGYLSDFVGRKRMFLFNLGVIAVFSFLGGPCDKLHGTRYLPAINGLRHRQGYAPAITLLTELSPKNKRGKYHHYYFVSIAFGLLLAAMIGFALGPLGSFQ